MSTEEGFDVVAWLTACVERWDDKPMTFVIAFTLLFLFDTFFCKTLYDVVPSSQGPTAKAAETVGASSKDDPAAKYAKKPKKRRPQKSRWFALHVFANLIVCIASVKPFIATLLDPAGSADGTKYSDTSIFGTATHFPLVVIITVHFYHMAIFKDLSSADYFHHLMFIPTMGIPGLFWSWGPCQAFLCVFISGLPGGIEYFFLALSKMGFVTDRSFLKKLAALQNTWCRWPGIILATYHIYMGIIYGTLLAPWYLGVFVGGLSSFNAIYYGFQAISAFTKDNIVKQFQTEGPAMFENRGSKIRVDRPGS